MGTNKSLIQLIIEAIGAKKATDDIDGVAKKSEASFKKLGNSMSHAGKIMTVGLTAPIVAGFAKMIDSASDMSETVNKVNVVFGEASQEVLDFGKDAARGLGMSEQKAMEAAGTFGNLFTSMGLTTDKSAEMSTELLTLAADLASFNNIDPTVALEKLRAGLVGEVEPLRALGVNLSAAAVELKAVELGLIAEGEEMTAAAKAQASYALIMEQTTNAQGDFARTSDGLANSSRILKAELEDVVAEMGQNLLPMALDATKFIGDLVGKFGDMEPAGQKAVLVFMGIVAALGPVLTIGGKILTMLPMLKAGFVALNTIGFGPLGLAITAVGGSIALFSWLVREGNNDSREFVRTAAIAEVAMNDWEGAIAQGIVTERQHRLIMNEVEKSAMTEAEAFEWLNQRIKEHERAIEAAIPGDEIMIDRHREGARSARELGDGIGYAGDAINKFSDVFGDYAERSRVGEDATNGLATSYHLLADNVSAAEYAMFVLTTSMAGPLGNEIDNFTTSQGDLEQQMADVATRMGELNTAADRWIINAETGESTRRGMTSAEITELDGLQTEYDELGVKYEENAAAHNRATLSILYDLFAQQIAMSDIPIDDQAYLLGELATRWGLVDEATATAIGDMGTLIEDFNGENVANLLSGADDVAEAFGVTLPSSMNTGMNNAATSPGAMALEIELRELGGLADSISGTYDMEFNVSVTGDPIPNLPSASTGYQPIAQATGGDWWVTKPTLFLAGEAGPERAIFVPEGDELPSGAGKGGGGDTYNIINRDKASAALTMAWISQARDKRLNAEMGLS